MMANNIDIQDTRDRYTGLTEAKISELFTFRNSLMFSCYCNFASLSFDEELMTCLSKFELDAKGDSEEDRECADIDIDGTTNISTNTQNISEHKYELQEKIQRQNFFFLPFFDLAG